MVRLLKLHENKIKKVLSAGFAVRYIFLFIVYMEETNNKRCFYITPIGEDGSQTNNHMKDVVKIIKPVITGLGYSFVMPNEDIPGSITDFIFKHILEDELVVADLTGLNPNVMYELGVRHSIEKHAIIICEKGTILPFDTKDARTLFFENSFSGSDKLKERLITMVLESENNPVNNPVVNAMKINNYESVSKKKLNEEFDKYMREHTLTDEDVKHIVEDVFGS